MVRSVACKEASSESSTKTAMRCMEGKTHCRHCGNLCNMEKFVSKVVWWAEKIRLALLMQSMALGERVDTHRSYEEMYEELDKSVGRIPHHCANASCRQFVQMRLKALPRKILAQAWEQVAAVMRIPV